MSMIVMVMAALFVNSRVLKTGHLMVKALSSNVVTSSSIHSKGNTDKKSNSVNHPNTNLWYQNDSKIRTVMAPMVAQSDLAFRHLCRNHGTDLCYTQMIHAANYVTSPKNLFGRQHLDVFPNSRTYWDECMDMPSVVNAVEGIETETLKKAPYYEGGPLIVQLAGNDVDIVTKAAKYILEQQANDEVVSGIDLNCGCPQSIARKGRYGAFLMEEETDTVCAIVENLKKMLPSHIAVSVKMRLPTYHDNNNSQLLKTRIHSLLDAGIDSFTLHGRTLVENKTKVRSCNWDAIATAVQIAREYTSNPEYPVIANGGIEYSSQVAECLDYTAATAVMSSEALLENPGIFDSNAKDDSEYKPWDLFERQLSYSREYLQICSQQFPPIPGSLGKDGGSFNTVRGHLFKMLYRYLEEQPDLRSKLGNSHCKEKGILTLLQGGAFLDELEERFSSLSESQWCDLTSSSSQSSWYRRHRAAIGKVHVRGKNEPTTAMTIEEKKMMMKERIAKLKTQRLAKTKI